nr:polycalin [Plutella xylostella]
MGDAKITCQGLNMNRLLVLVFTLLGVFCVTSGQVVQTGQCEQLTVTVSADFNIETFTSTTWNEVGRTRANVLPGGACSNLGFKAATAGTYDASYKVVEKNFPVLSTGTLSTPSASEPAKLKLSLDGTEIDFWILLQTSNSALAFSCQNIDNSRRGVSVWKLSSTKSLTSIQETAMDNIITNQLFINVASEIEKVDQSDLACTELVDIPAGQRVVLPGACSDIPAVQDFNVTKFLGRWYEIRSYYSENSVGNCPSAFYDVSSTPGQVLVQNSEVNAKQLRVISGVAEVMSLDNSAVLNVSLEVIPNFVVSQELKVLATDYENYAITYTCVDLENNERQVNSWIAGRRRELPETAAQDVAAFIDTILDLNDRYYIEAKRTPEDCFYYPEVVANQPVVFPGSCDKNIRTVANFVDNLTDYLGLWNELASYPSLFQQGTCNNAFYSPNNEISGRVDVYNTQVIGEQLLDIYGYAEVASDDGTGKLTVTFPSAGPMPEVSTSYWILSTDYQNYALVYTCEDIPETYERRVWSWKLSRTKQLTTEAEAEINRVIESIDVLEPRYYQTRDQSPSGCFYYPQPEPGKRVVFPGKCDQDIAAEPNFQAERFAGQWFETEAYPKEFQPGQCIKHNFTQATGGYSLQSSHVLDQFLTSTSATVTSTDGSAKFTIAGQTGAQNPFPFWILKTDYTNYALAYSCVDLEDDRRAVYSWKLSRSKTPTSESTTAIAAAIEPIDVLRQDYFEDVYQTDDACFNLPEIPEGEIIVLPGQCDPTIPAMPNFNPANYTGTWRSIESYPSAFENGECRTARYTLDATTGVVTVLNSQVNGDTLNTMTGTAVVADDADGTGKLKVTFPAGPGQTVTTDLWILDTDYETFSLAYSCANIGTENRQVLSWKLSRTKELTDEAKARIKVVVDRTNVLNERYYARIGHLPGDCFYYPELNPTTPVRFPGQCDTTIKTVPDFDVAAYLNYWHEIEAYPSTFQQGTCNNARYRLNPNIAGRVDVYNTQVINQTLDFVDGYAVVASDDGSGKLTVSFPIAGTDNETQTSYWILATDYTSYALVYSCTNINEEERVVFSWKIGRTQAAFSAQANSEMDAIINSIDVLDPRYYQKRDQSADGCFFIPEPNGRPVEAPGRCDETIQAVQGFDTERFANVWHEVEAYPKDQTREGDCINYNFITRSSNSMTIDVNQVFGLSLVTTPAILEPATDDGSGKFNIRLVNNPDVLIPFWILNVDYDSHALAYSCLNLDNGKQGVWSWKLSRSKTLSTDAQASISATVSNVDVLGDDFYERIDQGEDSCFYLPDLTPNEPAIFPGRCNANIPTEPNFDPIRYEGTWYNIESYHTGFQGGECNTARYTLNSQGSFEVLNSQVTNQQLQTVSGTAETVESGKFVVTLPVGGNPEVTTNTTLWLLATDYDSYALLYSCEDLEGDRRRVYAWKSSRTRSLTAEAEAAIDAKIAEIDVLEQRYFRRRQHTPEACFYYPPPSATTPIIFPGTCDLNIPVEQNFNVLDYLGTWNEIQGYPSTFQQGTCNNAFYSPNPTIDGRVEVYNTQVVNQTLDEINGYAVVASDDNSAKLTVSFPIQGTDRETQTSYWVLATDYKNYALVYSCEPVPTTVPGSEQRAVFSWKLSRTKELSNEANAVMDRIINSIDVLDQRYYQIKDQTPEGCFFEPLPTGRPVVYPGKCDANIRAVPNFDLTKFVGVWNEIEAYPKDQTQGVCINYEYESITGSTSSLNINVNQVFGLDLVSSVATLTSATSDGSAKFEIKLQNPSGADITIPFWILDVDYESHALAYSCVDLGNDRQGVWSWKLSKTRTLTDNAVTSMNAVIDTVPVLENRLFERIDQGADACFYLPDIGLDKPAIFPGQCDETIPTQQNFDPERYTGRWYDIQSYYDNFQNGECNDANYTLTPEGVVDVYNTQVVNERLDTINGVAVTTDESGKLLVTFPVAGADFNITSTYWILQTDYTSYSLVYSCTNIPNTNTRRVFSWKLSRTRQLTAAANTAINAIISNIDVLEQRYYVIRDHSPTACFYYPDVNPEKSVRFRGRCDESIAVQNNFNINNWEGNWYDISSYPSDSDRASCALWSHNLEGNTLQVQESEVLRQELYLRNGSAIALGGWNGKLNVQYTDGDAESTSYWVLNTDYDNYALVYSCENTDAEYYEVSSWKLSRTKDLSAEYLTQIDNAISNVKELRNEYYLARKQDADSCFYYPETYGAPVVLPGTCQAQAVKPNFNINEFSGTWYEAARFPSELQDGDCASFEFNVNGEAITIKQTIIYNERLQEVTANVVQSTPGVFTATFPVPSGGTQELTLYVLDTDYDNYALIFSCVNLEGNEKQIYSWKLSKSQAGLTADANTEIDAIVSSNIDLFERYYEVADQTIKGCFYYPEFDDSVTAIELPGPCDDSIKGVPDFQAGDYLGPWYEVARYPQGFETGECARATYSEGPNGSVRVFNEVVFNQTLDTIVGSAVVASEDGSGVLNVSFNVNGMDTLSNYYILSTDYKNYALVYSCRNIPNGRRRVSSWKLSRTKTLAPEYSAVIDDVVKNTQGLLEDYYSRTSQTDADCFYVPEYVPNQDVVFRGQCAEVTGVQGFDVTKYVGWWHEIETYPTEADRGTCISSQISPAGTQYQVVDTNVYADNTATVSRSALQVSSNGRLTKTNAEGTTEIWVLETDYDNYALLYSCVNIDAEHRRVWSAKHSKVRSPGPQLELSPAIAANEVLAESLFEKVSQTDDSCFYYPPQEYVQDQVILPGQCDEDIPVVQNFDAAAYTGTWYQIERYPQRFESKDATCIGARYSLNEETGVVTLLNWQVIGDELDQLEGNATISSTDGSAKLIVNLPIRDSEDGAFTSTSLYVLTTDYVSHSLAYSCTNLNDYQRTVGFWKLSRERTLSASSASAINSYLSRRQEHRAEYFIQVTQNEDCDEPSSSALVKSSVLIIAICALMQRVFA